MDRMMESYPQHPSTQQVLSLRINSEEASRRYDRLGAALDLMQKRFPGGKGNWLEKRGACFSIANDKSGWIALARKCMEGQLKRGNIEALDYVAGLELDKTASPQQIGDYWKNLAWRYTGTRSQMECLLRALSGYYNGYERAEGVVWDGVQSVLDPLMKQTLDPELEWGMAFADINFLSRKGDLAAAVKAINQRIEEGQTYHDLSVRLDLYNLYRGLGKGNFINDGVALSQKLKKVCPTKLDTNVLDFAMANMYSQADQPLPAAQHYLTIVNSDPFPAMRVKYLNWGLNNLLGANSPGTIPEIQKLMARMGKAQEILPGMLGQMGSAAVRRNSKGLAMQVHGELAKKYPASNARDDLEAEIVRMGR
jgi:hypothetical protein